MRIYKHSRDEQGFSLLEVLIAVVVLAMGLLALASLQAKLSTNSADAKARSRIAALVTSVIDYQRAQGYNQIAPILTTDPNPVTSTFQCVTARRPRSSRRSVLRSRMRVFPALRCHRR